MWRAVLIHKRGAVLPLGVQHRDWQAALAECLKHVGTITPGWYRLGEVGVDRVGEGLVFATLEHPTGGWILNAVGPEAELPTLEEVHAILRTWGLKTEKRVLLVADGEEV